MIKENIKRLIGISVSFLIPVIVVLVIFACAGIIPFGNNSIVHGDMNNQYIQLFAYLKQNLNSPMNMIYNYSGTLGGGFFGVLTYYLMNPLNLLVYFFSIGDIPIFLEVLTIMKIGLASCTMYIFFTYSEIFNFKNIVVDETIKISLATSYALMTYVFNYKECLMWLDGIILLPIVTLGLEKLILKRNIKIYIVGMVIAVICNYYFGVIIGLAQCVFLFGYCIFKIYVDRSKINIILVQDFIISNLVVLGLTAWILIPSYLSTSNVVQNHSFSLKMIYKLPYLASSLLNGTFKGDVPALYIGLLPLIAIGLLLLNKKVKIRLKIFLFGSLAALFASTCIDVTYLIWHVFTWPNGFPQRETFVITFFMLGLAGFSMNNIAKLDGKTGIFAYATVVMSICVITLVGYTMNLFSLSQIIFICAITLAVSTLLILYERSIITKHLFGIFLLLLVAIDMGFNGYKVQNTQTSSSIHLSNYRSFTNKMSDTIKEIKKNDKSFFRIGQSIQSSDNDPFLFNYNGVSGYLSQNNNSITNLLSGLGYYQNHGADRWSNYNNGSTNYVDSLLGIKYVVNSNDKNVNDNITGINSYMGAKNETNVKNDTNKINVKKNTDAFPIVFNIFNNENIKLSGSTEKDPFNVQNKLFTSLSGEKGEVFLTQNVNEIGQYKYQFIASRQGTAYLYFPTNQETYYKSAKVYLNGKLITSFFGHVDDNGQFENGIVKLTNLQAKSMNIIEVKYDRNSSGTSKISTKPYVSIGNDAIFKRMKEKMVTKTIKVKNVRSNSIQIETTKYFKKNKIMLTVPFDKGWKANVDGKNVKISKTVNNFIEFKLTQGRHKVHLTYELSGLRIGVSISAISILLVLAQYLNKRRNQKNG